ncbi:hypothetical protein [Ottowia thiooxydans]|uniref:hypothetical protein n=1 Tax=Ottowia thiooxydans TaxID=219182 RepID=UPI0004162781|nr:hypothetical protein [Ottowia thiooxydans]
MSKYALALAALLTLVSCGGEGADPAPAPTDPVRFTQIAPAPQDQPTHAVSQAIEYELGHLPVRGIAPFPSVFLTPIRGLIRFPEAALAKSGRVNDRFPIVLLLHGNHEVTDPSYRGYDYLAQDLAAHGYVAVSIDANAINASSDDPFDPSNHGDTSSVSRGQLILGTLDQLRNIDKSGGPGWMSALMNKLDFERIGVMGHSRGGQGLTNAFKFNLQRESVTPRELRDQLAYTPETFANYPDLLKAVVSPGVVDIELFTKAIETEEIAFSPSANSVRPYNFRGGLLLAPTDFYGTVGLANIPLAVVLPSCDGDVFNFQGARTYDNNRYGFDYDTAANIQVVVRGANHNYYNTEWRRDDTNPPYLPHDAYCDAERNETPHLNPEDQRRGGLFLINSFMRHFVGGEPAFAPYWNGLAQLPSSACPQGEWPCDARVALTIQKDAASRLSIHRFEYADSLGRNDLGGAVTLRGFDAASLCEMPYGNSQTEAACMPARLPGFETRTMTTGGLRSISEHIQLSWSSPKASMSTMLDGISAKAYDTLSFRVAVVRPFGQEIEVSLTDASGKSASVKASRFSDALYLGPTAPRSGSPLIPDVADLPFGNGEPAQLMNMVAIPLSAFPELDLSRLSELRLHLPAQSGKIALADVQFQKLGR